MLSNNTLLLYCYQIPLGEIQESRETGTNIAIFVLHKTGLTGFHEVLLFLSPGRVNDSKTGISDSHITVSFDSLQAFYQIFAEQNDGVPLLDYTDMVSTMTSCHASW